MNRQWQDAVDAWHRDRYPAATVHDVALKLAEEAGEACGAVVEASHPSMNRVRGARRLADELGDVFIACAALASRAGIDLERAVADRWKVIAERQRQ